MLGQSSGDLTGLTTHKPAQTPGPDCDFLHPKFLEKIKRLVVLTERSIQILVFGRILFPVGVRDQQAFREKPVLRGVSAIGFDFSRRGWWFFAYSYGCCCWSLGFLVCHLFLVISRGLARNDG